MNKTIAELQAAKLNLENQIKALNAKASRTEVESAQLEASNAELRATKAELRTAELEAADADRRKTDAKAAVQAAVKDGRIPAQNTALQAKWEERLTSDPSDLIMLQSMEKPALNARRAAGTGQVQIVAEDPANVLNAYAAAEEDPRARGALYAREIAPLLAKGHGLIGLDSIRPAKMRGKLNGEELNAANSFGTLVGNIISQRVLELLRYELPELGRITTDFSDAQAKYNQSILTRYVGIPTVGTYNTTTGYPAVTTAAATDVTVTINQHKCVELDLQAEQLSGTARRLFDEQIPAMSYALAKDLIDYVYGLILAATFTNTAISETSQAFGRNTLTLLSKSLTDQGVPKGSQWRTLLLNTAYFAALQNDASIISLAAFQKPELIYENQLPPVAGFTIVEAANLPSTGLMTGFGMSKSALVAATRLPIDYSTILPGASYGSVNTVTNPDTGASVMQVAYVNHALGTANFRLAWMYGAAAGQIKAGTLLTSPN